MPATQPDEISLIVYAPGFEDSDARPMAVIHAMERTFPGLRLDWTTSRGGQRTLLADRDAWLAQKKWVGEFPLLHNGDFNSYVSVTGWRKPAHLAAGGREQFEVHAVLPMNTEGIAVAAAVLEAIAEEAQAYWGHATPFSAGVEIAQQTKHRPDDLKLPPRRLPVIQSPSAMRSPEIPHRLGWLNYWSAAAARTIGFPDPARDTDLLSRARRTATCGWIVQLTDAPLMLDNPAHFEALNQAYERFPEIGGRTTP